LLRHARKQLHHAGLLGSRPKRSSQPSGERMRSGILPASQIFLELALFDCLQTAQLEELALRVGTRLLESDELLFSQGAADATLYVVASGILEVTQETEGAGTVTLGCLGAGEYLGEIGLLTGAAHAATARARTHCCIYQLSREAIEPLLAANAEMAAAFDKSARRGLDLLHRSVAVRATENMGAGSQLLQRIRAFFHSRPSV
jgi:CRP-like cAMP-binding protein